MRSALTDLVSTSSVDGASVMRFVHRSNVKPMGVPVVDVYSFLLFHP